MWQIFKVNLNYIMTKEKKEKRGDVIPEQLVWKSLVAVSNLQVGLLAALNQLVESRRSEVSVDVGRIEPLQSLHDYLLQDKWTEDAFRGSHAELVHVVDSCGYGKEKK